jgi:hypothetical protein
MERYSMDTILSVHTIRNPKKPTRNELATAFLVYDRALQAPLIDEVVTKRRDEEDLAAARHVIQQYKEEAPNLSALWRISRSGHPHVGSSPTSGTSHDLYKP